MKGDYIAIPYSLAIPRLEAEINNLVYKLYDLIPEEIKIVEVPSMHNNMQGDED